MAEPVRLRLGTHPDSHPLLEPSDSLDLFCPGKQRVRSVQGASGRQSQPPGGEPRLAYGDPTSTRRGWSVRLPARGHSGQLCGILHTLRASLPASTSGPICLHSSPGMLLSKSPVTSKLPNPRRTFSTTRPSCSIPSSGVHSSPALLAFLQPPKTPPPPVPVSAVLHATHLPLLI